jgi:hypothetical protein
MLGLSASPNTGFPVVDRDLIAAKLAELYDRIQRVRANVPLRTGSTISNLLLGRSAHGLRRNERHWGGG